MAAQKFLVFSWWWYVINCSSLMTDIWYGGRSERQLHNIWMLIACIDYVVSCMPRLTHAQQKWIWNLTLSFDCILAMPILLFLLIVFLPWLMLIACTVIMDTTGCEFLSRTLHANAVSLATCMWALAGAYTHSLWVDYAWYRELVLNPCTTNGDCRSRAGGI
jgi:hypothetical protein